MWNAAPGGQVWYGVKDTATNVWYGGWTRSDAYGRSAQIITGIPSSSCGHVFVADASDWGQAGAPAAQERTFRDDCGAMLSYDRFGRVVGDGFMAGTTAYVYVNNAYKQSVPVSKAIFSMYKWFGTDGTITLAYVPCSSQVTVYGVNAKQASMTTTACIG